MAVISPVAAWFHGPGRGPGLGGFEPTLLEGHDADA